MMIIENNELNNENRQAKLITQRVNWGDLCRFEAHDIYFLRFGNMVQSTSINKIRWMQ